MKLKAILLACAILSITTESKADYKELEKRYLQAKEYVQQNPAKTAKTLASSLALLAGIELSIWSDSKIVGASVVYCGYFTLNANLNNKPHEYLKSLIQKTKTELRKLKTNEQK